MKAAGCERTFSEHASGAAAERRGLLEVLSHWHAGDTLVVWRLNRKLAALLRQHLPISRLCTPNTDRVLDCAAERAIFFT
ncbi:recombinase family protein [Aureimonas ureilytica]|uniref:recombinase family protein n=1 Tax=Aureimonas ureilytica TaxID=401562 RepID=UPI001FCDD36A|nr:recombinase family protein [Aureimonas ureilytica]